MYFELSDRTRESNFNFSFRVVISIPRYLKRKKKLKNYFKNETCKIQKWFSFFFFFNGTLIFSPINHLFHFTPVIVNFLNFLFLVIFSFLKYLSTNNFLFHSILIRFYSLGHTFLIFIIFSLYFFFLENII